jgi:hypothetical protein
MTADEFYAAAEQSERVRHLLAAAIQTAARIELGVHLDSSQANDLARNHTLPQALEKLREKLRLHANVDQRFRTTLAVAEAAVTDANGRRSNVDLIIKLREEARTLGARGALGRVEFTTFQDRIRHLQDDLTTWSDGARRFYRNVNDLYQKRRRELTDLCLPENVQTKALGELDEMFVRVIDQFEKL